jgi:hypothetical protein
MGVAQKMSNWFDVVQFQKHDIVRSDFVKALIIAVED